MRYDIFLVDADDTIFDFAACSQNALSKAMELCSVPWEEGDYARYQAINDRLWKALERKEITHEELFERRFKEFLRGKGLQPKGDLLNSTYVSCLAKEAVLLDGAEEFLRLISDMGRVFIVTNGTASVQKGRFEKFDIMRFAEAVFISEEIGVYKPDKAYLDYVAESIDGFDARRAIVIGDGLTSDMLLAKNGGVDSIWFNPRRKADTVGIKPTYTACSYGEILQILRQV